MPRPDPLLIPGPRTVWTHLKTGRKYVVLGTVINATSGDQDGAVMVLHQLHDRSQWVHKLSEFIDGRFRMEAQ